LHDRSPFQPGVTLEIGRATEKGFFGPGAGSQVALKGTANSGKKEG